MDGLCFEAGGFGQPLGGPAGGARQQGLDALRRAGSSGWRLTGGLTDAGSAGDDHDLGRQGHADRRLLALGASVTPSSPAPTSMALSASMAGQGGWPARSVPEAARDASLGLAQMRQEDARLLPDGVGDHHPVGEFEVDRLVEHLASGSPAGPRPASATRRGAGRSARHRPPSAGHRRCRPWPGSSPSSGCRASARSCRRS